MEVRAKANFNLRLALYNDRSAFQWFTLSPEAFSYTDDEESGTYSNHMIFEYRDTPRDISDASNNLEYSCMKHRMLAAERADYDVMVNQYTGPMKSGIIKETNVTIRVLGIANRPNHIEETQ